MQHTGITHIECPYFKMALQNNPIAVILENEQDIPENFKHAQISWKIDKNALKEAMKSGIAVPGAKLSSGVRLVIK